MLARGNSDAATRLRRAKSVPSAPPQTVLRRAQSIDEASNYRNALAAATLAFENVSHTGHPQSVGKYQEGSRASRQLKKSNTLHVRRTKSSKRIRERAGARYRAGDRTTFGTGFRGGEYPRISWEQRASVGTRRTANWSIKQTVETPLPKRDKTPSQSSPTLRNSPLYSNAKATNSPEQVPTPTQLGPPHRGRLFYQNDEPVLLLGGECRVPIPAARENQTDEAIIALARDRYLQDYQNRSLKQKKSFLSEVFRHPFTKLKQEFGQGELSACNNDGNLSNSGPQLQSRQRSITTQQMHRFSDSLKRGLRRTFRRPTQSESQMPPQQVHTDLPHYRTTSYQSAMPDDMIDDETSIIRKHFSRSESPTPSGSQLRDDHFQLHQSLMERESLLSSGFTCSDGSRLTSWTDSSRQNTLLMHEIDQLPVIRERTEPRSSSIRSRASGADLFSGELPDIPLRQRSVNFQTLSASSNHRAASFAYKENVSPNSIGQRNLHVKECAQSNGNNPSNLQGFPFLSSNSSKWTLDMNSLSTTIRNVQDESYFGHLGDEERRISQSRREDVISPSIYSTRNDSEIQFARDSVTSIHRRPIQYGGTALVQETQPVSSWSITGLSENEARRPLQTSNEWRAWMKDELEELAHDVQISVTQEYSPRHGVGQHRRESAQTVPPENQSPPKDRQSFIPRRIFSDRARLARRPSEIMNDRFPMINTGRKTSAQSILPSSKPSCSGHSVTPRPVSPENQESGLQMPPGRRSVINIDQPNALASNLRYSKSLVTPLADEISTEDNFIPGNTVDQSPEVNKPSFASLKEIGNRKGTKHQSHVQPTLLDENFLLRIRRGPYAQSSSPSRGTGSSPISQRRESRISLNHENTPPSRGQQMAEEFIKTRSSEKPDSPNRSSPAFL